jgi:hypothetical protein
VSGLKTPEELEKYINDRKKYKNSTQLADLYEIEIKILICYFKKELSDQD